MNYLLLNIGYFWGVSMAPPEKMYLWVFLLIPNQGYRNNQEILLRRQSMQKNCLILLILHQLKQVPQLHYHPTPPQNTKELE